MQPKVNLLSKSIAQMLAKQPTRAEIEESAPLLNFDCTDVDKALIEQLTQRGVSDAAAHGVHLDYMLLQMDITTVHCNGCPLKLLQWLMSDLSDFSKDLLTIGAGLNRLTGRLHPDAARKLLFAETKQ